MRVSSPAVDVPKTQQVAQRLTEVYGPRQQHGSRDPLNELILTILSQNTSDRNSGRAGHALRARYRTWNEVLEAPTNELYETIRSAGLGNIKAPRIQAVLAEVWARRGSWDLHFLRDLPLPEAKRWLRSLPGIGPKTTACVLCFACNMPVLAVDTHVHRVSQRLGLIGPKVGADAAHDLLEGALLPDQVYAFHVNMILHGRQVCRALRPLCGRCPLLDVCAYGTQVGARDARVSSIVRENNDVV